MPLLQSAASALGWDGVVVSDVPALGWRVSVVARIRADVHRWRTRNGWPPEPDPAWLRSWFVPGVNDRMPLPAVDLIGTLVMSPPTDRALHACGTLITLAPCALVVPDATDCDPWRLTELNYYGLGIVSLGTDGSPVVVVRPENRSTEFGTSLFGRRLLEVLYERVLDTAASSGVPALERPESERTPRD
jgi:hypothetical protein